MLRFPRWKCILKASFILVGLCLAFLVYTGRLTQFTLTCTHEKSRETIKKLCDLYKSKIINGSLCNELCSGKIEYINCLHQSRGKVVFLAKWNNQKIILKTKYASIDSYAAVYTVMENLEGVSDKLYPEDAIFKSMIESQAQAVLGTVIKDGEDVVNKFWFGNWPKDRLNMNSFHTAMNSLWTLILQDEYVFLKYHNTHPNLPQVYGSCGYFYAVEYTPPGIVFDPGLLNIEQQLQAAPWPGRAYIALGLLNLIKSFDTSFSEKLYHCDIKEGNFGMDPVSKLMKEVVIKAIDVDMVFYDNKVAEIMGQGDCVKDSDCNFIHCRGRCNQVTKICRPEVISSNLQVFCDNVFLPRNGKPGLLRFPPSVISKELANVLDECSNVGTSTKQDEIHEKLRKLLVQSLR
ncbi:divergent protein kinase domain 1C-like [Antedon mediterranea]|uniref:divergent protein kinase domain 1C-like n=1 Tax=Antedon mediterranea TaxID=105859 RepID=UPI003AF63770